MGTSAIDVLMETSAEHLRAGRWSEASGSLALVLEMEPRHTRALFLRGVVCTNRGDYASALEALGQLTGIAPQTAGFPEVLELKGIALLGRGQFAASIAAFKDMFAASPEYQERKARDYIRQVSPLDRRLYWKAPGGLFEGSREAASVFSSIYAKTIWGGGSGAGSNIERTAAYAGLVQYLVSSRAVRTIVDLGCGDWRFSRYLDLTGVRYLGVDVVPSVIEANNAQYATDNIRFELADVAAFELAGFDLVLCKDVLQHLSNANVLEVCGRLPGGKCWLVTNDFHPANEDCQNGDTRPLDPTGAPFHVPAKAVFAFGGKVAFLAEGHATGGSRAGS
jgi:2-polyprenyl-3-methyl-5-hydroxy-6-metoxy-1,4-benzoquinol methylase